MQAKPNYVVALVMENKDVHLYVNGVHCSSFFSTTDSVDEFDTIAQDMAEMYNTEAQYINISDSDLEAVFGNKNINMLFLDWEAADAVKLLNIQPIVAEAIGHRENICRDLEGGEAADIWFDANEFGNLTAAWKIKKTQSAMQEAVLSLRNAEAEMQGAKLIIASLLAGIDQTIASMMTGTSSAKAWLDKQSGINAATVPLILSAPLSSSQVYEIFNSKGYISVVIPVELGDLIASDIDGVNDLVESKILLIGVGYLSDIAYRVAGHIPPGATIDTAGGIIMIEVYAKIHFQEIC